MQHMLFPHLHSQTARRTFRQLQLTNLYRTIHHICATEIQRIWRGCRIRSLVRQADTRRILLRWRWGSRDLNQVYVAGEFNDWKSWRMVYLTGLDEHRITIPRKCVPQSARELRYKFVVDGLWTCDGSLPMAEDSSGNVNNTLALKRPIPTNTFGAHRRIPFIAPLGAVAGQAEHVSKVRQPSITSVASDPAVQRTTSRLPPPSSVIERVR